MITRNSAKCVTCGVEIESTHRHHMAVHYCKANPRPAAEWVDGKLTPVPLGITFNFAVDGGTSYLRRMGDGYIDTSITEGE